MKVFPSVLNKMLLLLLGLLLFILICSARSWTSHICKAPKRSPILRIPAQAQSADTFEYNPAPILRKMNKILSGLKFPANFFREVPSGNESFRYVFTVPVDYSFPDTLNEVQKTALIRGFTHYGRSKKEARGKIGIEILRLFNIDLTKLRKVFHQPGSISPLEEVNILKAQNNSIVKLQDPLFAGDTFKGSLSLDGNEYKAEYEYYKDFSFGRNKLALKLLKDASYNSEAAKRLYQKLSKEPLLYIGSLFSLSRDEDKDTEFKGDADVLKTMKESTVANRFEKYGESICAFLNSRGGSLFIGIHDSGVVQGVEIASCDQFKLRMLGSYRSRIEPDPSEFIDISFHPTQRFELSNPDPAPPRTTVVDEYVDYLERELKRLQAYIRALPPQIKKSDVEYYVLEVRCLRTDPSKVFVFDGRGYVRRDGFNGKMSFSELSERIVKQYLAGNDVLKNETQSTVG